MLLPASETAILWQDVISQVKDASVCAVVEIII